MALDGKFVNWIRFLGIFLVSTNMCFFALNVVTHQGDLIDSLTNVFGLLVGCVTLARRAAWKDLR